MDLLFQRDLKKRTYSLNRQWEYWTFSQPPNWPKWAELRQFGNSKERRSDCTQVVFGLLVDRDGIPLGFEVYPGNTFEGKTLSDIVDKMRKKFKVRRFIFVADRGLLSRGNIEKLGEDKQLVWGFCQKF